MLLLSDVIKSFITRDTNWYKNSVSIIKRKKKQKQNNSCRFVLLLKSSQLILFENVVFILSELVAYTSQNLFLLTLLFGLQPGWFIFQNRCNRSTGWTSDHRAIAIPGDAYPKERFVARRCERETYEWFLMYLSICNYYSYNFFPLCNFSKLSFSRKSFQKYVGETGTWKHMLKTWQ